MISELVDAQFLTCPACRGPLPNGAGLRNAPLQWEDVHAETKGRPVHGLLRCSDCRSRYPLIDGVAVVLADTAEWVRGQAGSVQARVDLPGPLADFLEQAWDEDGAAGWHRQMRAVYSRSLPASTASTKGPVDELTAPLRTSSAERLGARRDALMAHLGSGARVLDAGCGVGENALEMASLGARVVAFDRDFAALQQLSQMLRHGSVDVPVWTHGGADFSTRPAVPRCPEAVTRVAVVAGDVLDPPFAAAAFDAVMALNLIDNVSEPVTCVRQLHGVLRSGGRLVVASPFDWSPRATARAARLGDGVRALGSSGWDPVPVLHALLEGRLVQWAPELTLSIVHSEELPWVLVRHDRSAHLFVSHLVEADKP